MVDSAPAAVRSVRWLLAAALAATAVVPVAAQAKRASASATPPPVTATGCEEHEAWVDGDAKAVAAALPAGYSPVTDPSGTPLVFARAEHCDAVTAGGHTAPATMADWGVIVQSTDGQGCASGIPLVGAKKGDVPPACNWYTLALVSDNRRVVDWLRQGTPDLPAAYVPGLVYKVGKPDATGQSTFHFATPSSVSSPFTIDDVDSFRPGTISLRGNYFFRVPQGTVRMIVSTDDLTGGHADTTLRAASGSALAHLLGATAATSIEPYNEFGVIRAAHGVERKQLVGPALPGERLNSFDGSCSVAGDVTFSPPATNQQQPTIYTYDATGTCTGTVDGRSIDNAAVHLHQSGHADASCMQAMSFPPGTGVMTLPGQVRLPYTLDFESTGTELDGDAYGTRSGQATGHATFLTQRSSPSILTDCASTGARKAPLDMSFSTVHPLVSRG